MGGCSWGRRWAGRAGPDRVLAGLARMGFQKQPGRWTSSAGRSRWSGWGPWPGPGYAAGQAGWIAWPMSRAMSRRGCSGCGLLIYGLWLFQLLPQFPWIGHADYADNAVVARNLAAGRGYVLITLVLKTYPNSIHPAETWPISPTHADRALLRPLRPPGVGRAAAQPTLAAGTGRGGLHLSGRAGGIGGWGCWPQG